jgi:hypothetical protein
LRSPAADPEQAAREEQERRNWRELPGDAKRAALDAISRGHNVVLHPSGRAPVAFAGQKLAEAGGRIVAGQERNRWHELALYRLAGGGQHRGPQYVLAIRYRTQWLGEHDRCEVIDSSAAGDLVAELQAYDPCGHVLGYPPGEQYEAKRARLHSQLRQDWEAAVSDLLAAAGPDFVERLG